MTKPNWANRTIFTGDNLDVMRGMNSDRQARDVRFRYRAGGR